MCKLIIVSACLAGLNVRYDGGDCLQPKIKQLVAENKAVTVCPEVLGGLMTPRDPAEIVGGDGFLVLEGKAKVVTNKGKDVTDQFIKGANCTLQIVKQLGGTTVVLKENSPSCGSHFIYDGTFCGNKIRGIGVTAALLMKHRINVINEQQFIEILPKL